MGRGKEGVVIGQDFRRTPRHSSESSMCASWSFKRRRRRSRVVVVLHAWQCRQQASVHVVAWQGVEKFTAVLYCCCSPALPASFVVTASRFAQSSSAGVGRFRPPPARAVSEFFYPPCRACIRRDQQGEGREERGIFVAVPLLWSEYTWVRSPAGSGLAHSLPLLCCQLGFPPLSFLSSQPLLCLILRAQSSSNSESADPSQSLATVVVKFW